MMKYYKTLSLGCKVNTYEVQAIKELLNQNGYIESIDSQCDVFIINTCAVTQVGEQKSRQMIRKAISKYPEATIVVMGCYSQLHEEVVKAIEGVDAAENTGSVSTHISASGHRAHAPAPARPSPPPPWG